MGFNGNACLMHGYMCWGLVVAVYVDGESGEVKGWDSIVKMDMCRTSVELKCTLANNQQGDSVPGVCGREMYTDEVLW